MATELSLQTPLIRDLAWVIASPPLIGGQIDNCWWTDASFWQQAIREIQPKILQFDKKPQALNELLYHQRDRRLGHRFETLLSIWFINNPRYQILQQNLAIQTKTGTLGEFDFIIKDLLTNKVQHWEVACKFYLGLPNTKNIENWHGPMLKDRLAIKYKKLQTHQSHLSFKAESIKILSELDIKIDQHICLMKGRLFYPLSHNHYDKPTLVSSTHLHGWWAKPNSFIRNKKRSNYRWKPLSKQQWLANQYISPTEQSYNATEIVEYFLVRDQQHPLCIAGFEHEGELPQEIERGFLVAENWPNTLNLNDNTTPFI